MNLNRPDMTETVDVYKRQPVNRRDIFLRIGQSHELGKANFQSYKKPLLSGPSAKIIRPAVASVKEFRHFRRF